MARISLLLLAAACSRSVTVAASNPGWTAKKSAALLPRGGEISDSPPSSSSSSNSPSSPSSYASLCDAAKSAAIERASRSLEEMRRSIAGSGTVLSGFGSSADSLCAEAVSEYARSVPSPGDDSNSSSDSATYERKLEELEGTLDSSLQVLYLKQLALCRESALQSYRSNTRVTEASDYEAMLSADGQFVKEAEDSTRSGSDWDYSAERSYLQSVMNDIAQTRKKLIDVQSKATERQNVVLQVLQQQQQIIQQLQMQMYGQTSPWNAGVAYRIPDTNLNVQGSYQAGKANVQISCVPDEYAPMLGPNGFTNGVGPGNLGLSLNLSV